MAASVNLGAALAGPSRLIAHRPRTYPHPSSAIHLPYHRPTLCPPFSLSSTTCSSLTHPPSFTSQRRYFSPIASLASILASIPEPGLAIIGATLAVRTATTLPVTLWQRARLKRAKELVEPEVRKWNEKLMISVLGESRRKGLDHEGYRKEVKRQLALKQSELHKIHNTHPTLTLIAPLAIHIPILITLSLIIRTAIEIPDTPLHTASFLWMNGLSEPDGGVLPFLGGGLAFLNAEMAARRAKRADEMREAEKALKAAERERRRLEKATLTGKGHGRGLKGMIGQMTEAGPQARSFSTSFVASATPKPSVSSHIRRTPNTPSSKVTSANTSKPVLSIPKPSSSRTPLQPSSRVIQPKPNISFEPKAGSTSQPSIPLPSSEIEIPMSPRRANPISTPSSNDDSQPGKPEKRVVVLTPAQITSNIITYAMRGGAVLFIPIAGMVPAGLALYWTTSMMFTILQNVLLDWLDARAATSKASTAIQKEEQRG